MITPPERSPERDLAIESMLPFVPFTGWTVRTLVDAAGPDADLLFTGGSVDMIETYVDLADRHMEAAVAALDLSMLRVPARVHRVIALRFEQGRYYKEAIARALGVLAVPSNSLLALKISARTIDSIWFAAGDRSADMSWYTKRAILTPIYAATLLYWLRDQSSDDAATMAFLDRRLAGVGRLGKLRRRFGGTFGRARADIRPTA